MDSTLSEHNQHYAPSNIDAAVSAALTALYNDDATLTIENLAGLDQFHTGGIQSTHTLAKRAADTLRATLTRAGFRELAWNDPSNWSLAWFQERQREQQSASVPSNTLGLQLLLGADVSAMIRNHLLNLQEGRIRIVECVLERL